VALVVKDDEAFTPSWLFICSISRNAGESIVSATARDYTPLGLRLKRKPIIRGISPTVRRALMQARRTLTPGQKGAKKILERYGEQLACVRYRYDEQRRKRFTTIEIIVEESPLVSA
jgi:hypothetical protein